MGIVNKLGDGMRGKWTELINEVRMLLCGVLIELIVKIVPKNTRTIKKIPYRIYIWILPF